LNRSISIANGEGELNRLVQTFDETSESLEQHVTERDQAENALQESQRTLSTLMSNLPGMAYRCRSDGKWTMEFVSEGCFGLTGYRPTELIENRKVSYGQLIHPVDRESAWNEVQTALQEKSFQITYRIITATGEEKWAWEQGRGVFSPAGDLLALEGYVIDTTEQVLAQEKLEQRVADRTRELAALYEITAVASASLDLETILENSLDRVLTVIGSKVGAVHLHDEASGVLRLASQRRWSLSSSTMPVLAGSRSARISYVTGAASAWNSPPTLTTLQLPAALVCGGCRWKSQKKWNQRYERRCQQIAPP
jgi:PAS domain S-box-containing protein